MSGCKEMEGVGKFFSGFYEMLKKMAHAISSKLAKDTPTPGDKPAPVDVGNEPADPEIPEKTPKPVKGVPNFITSWGERGVKPGQFKTPLGISVDYAGCVYVADTSNCRIQKFTSKGEFLAAFGKRGSDIGELDQPYGLTITGIGDIYISDNQNSRIVRIDEKGQFVDAKCNDGDDLGEVHQPIGLTFDEEGNLFVADAGNNRVQKLTYKTLEDNIAYSKVGGTGKNMGPSNLNNPWNNSFPKHNEGPNTGQFSKPWDVLCLPTGEVIVIDTFNHRVQKFGTDGSFITQWGQVGYGNDRGKIEFQFPTFATLDQYGFLLVVDTGNHRIQKFTQDGEFLGTWGGPGYGEGQFSQPHGIAVSPDQGDIFIVDTENNRIQRYSYSSSWKLWYEDLTKKKKAPVPEGVFTPTPQEVIF